jgi:hypothetical protein
MKKNNLTLSYCSILLGTFLLLGCAKSETPGPLTTVRGIVKEDISGKPLSNVQLQVVKRYITLFSGAKYENYDIITTGADGSYNLKFTPHGAGTFFLEIINIPANYIFLSTQPVVNTTYGLTLDQVNTLNFTLARVYNVNIHLKNNSNHNRTAFHYFILDCCSPGGAYGGIDISPIVIDTVMNFKLPQLTLYTFQSIFYNQIVTGPYVAGFSDSLSFKKSFYINRADTNIAVVNP